MDLRARAHARACTLPTFDSFFWSMCSQIDVNEPPQQPGTASWAGRVRTNPLEHRLWKKRVSFIQVSAFEDILGPCAC